MNESANSDSAAKQFPTSATMVVGGLLLMAFGALWQVLSPRIKAGRKKPTTRSKSL